MVTSQARSRCRDSRSHAGAAVRGGHVRRQLVGGGGKKFTQTKTISRIAKGGTQSVTFKDLFASQQSAPEYSKPYTLTITSEKVPGEHNLTNNVNTYTVFFTLTS